MRLIRPNPTKFNVYFIPGYCGNHELKRRANWRDRAGNGSLVRHNFVFEATLIPATPFFRSHPSAIFTWMDKETNTHFNMNARYMAEMAKLIAEGLIIPVDGGFKGLYTFVNQSGTYSVAPAQGHECAKSRRKNFEKA